MMSSNSDRLRVAIQKLTEAIWNLEQLDSMSPEMKAEYSAIQRVRERLMVMLKSLAKA